MENTTSKLNLKTHQMPQAQTLSNKNSYIDYLRAIAVVLVVLYHGLQYNNPNIQNALTESGWIGVELFFVLSGLLVTRSYLKRNPSLKTFYINRAWRIIPAYLCVLCLCTATALVTPIGKTLLPEILHNLPLYLTFTHNYSVAQPIPNLWSIAVEVQLWLLLPVIIYLIQKAKPFVNSLIILMIMLAIPILTRLFAITLNPTIMTGAYAFGTNIYAPTHTHLDGMFVGIFLGVYQNELQSALKSSKKPILLTITGILITLTIILTTWQYRTYLPRPFMLALFQFSILAVGFGSLVLGLSSLAKKHSVTPPIIKWVSMRIYSLYLIQGMLLPLFAPLIATAGVTSTDHQMSIFLIYVIFTTFQGAVLYRCVERPFSKHQH